MNNLPKSRKARLFYVIFLVLILASSVPLTALTFYKLKVERDGFAERLQDSMKDAIQAVSRDVQLYVDSRRREATILGGLLSGIGADNVQALQAALAAQGGHLRESFRVLQIVDRDFKVLAAYDTHNGLLTEDTGRVLAQRSDMEGALGARGFGVTDVFISSATEHPSIRMAVPLARSAGEPWGLLAGTVDMRDIAWATSTPSPLPTRVNVIDRAGNQILTAGEVPNYVAPMSDLALWNLIKSTGQGWLPEVKVGSLRYSPGRYVELPTVGWFLLVEVPQDFVAERIEEFHWSSIGLLMITFLVVVVLAALLSNFVVMPITRLRSVAMAVAERNFSPAQVRAIPTVYEEMDKISQALEHMVLQVDRYFNEVVNTRDALTFGLTTIVEFRDPETGYHVERIAHYCRELAKKLAERAPGIKLSPDFIEDIFKAAPLHDVGKVAIPDGILLKPDQLTPREFEIMKTHTTAGAQAITSIRRKLPGASFLAMAIDIAMAHHEWWDGTGYPGNLTEEDIPLCARILALTDVYDALAFPRIYRPYRFGHKEIVELLVDKSGTHFDPRVVEAFVNVEEAFYWIRNEFADTGDAAGPSSAG